MVLVRVHVRVTRVTGGQVSDRSGQGRGVRAQPWKTAAFYAGLVRETHRGPRRSRELSADGVGTACSSRGSVAGPQEHVLSQEAHLSVVLVGWTRCPLGRAP